MFLEGLRPQLKFAEKFAYRLTFEVEGSMCSGVFSRPRLELLTPHTCDTHTTLAQRQQANLIEKSATTAFLGVNFASSSMRVPTLYGTA